jgi:imidazolonepropionase-like amidohydrolase
LIANAGLIRIDAEVLIPGRGDPIRPGVVVVEGEHITYAGPKAPAPDTPGTKTYKVPAAMPGMWECHAHFLGIRQANIENLITLAPQVGVLRAARDVKALLEAGFTSVREVGGQGTFLAQAVEEGTIPGPHIYASGGVLSQTGGHGDVHAISVEAAEEMWERHVGAPSLCDGPEDCRRVVRRQLRLGARVIKVCASGGVMSQVDHPLHQQFSLDELRAIVEEAARAERVVAAHCHGKPGIMAALEAGVRTIEHGTYLDEEGATAMKEAGAVLVPTRFIVEHLLASGKAQGMPDYAYAKIAALADRHFQAMQTAVALGVTMALGTDIFVTGVAGRNGEELGHMVRAGLTPLQAIEAATATGPLTVGPQAPKTGMLETGFDADVITLASDPLEDIALLADPGRVLQVWKRGVPCKPDQEP